MKIVKIEDSKVKSQVCELILRSLPEWFGIESAIQNYIKEVAELDTWVCYIDSNPIGFISTSNHNQYTAEVHIMGVLKSYHRMSIGERLLQRAEKYLYENTFKLLQVKTLGESRVNEEYSRTRKFYLKMGFIPVEEFKTLWNEENPCLLLIKPLTERTVDAVFELASQTPLKASSHTPTISPKANTADLQAFFDFIKEIDRLKKVERQSLVHSGGRRENSAEHSWHLALTVLTLQNYLPSGADINKAIKMAMLHDIVEIDAGDTFIYADQSNKKNDELLAAERIFHLLPKEMATELKNIWLEFEEGQCKEAQFVSAIDRFLPIFSNYLNDAYTWKMHNITVDQIMARNKPPITKGFPELWPIVEKMILEKMSSL